MKLLLHILFCLTSLSLAAVNAYALDVVKTVTPLSGGGKSTAYKEEILLRALKLTQPDYGDFIIQNTSIDMKPTRAMDCIQEGELINVAIIAANKNWDKNTLAIKKPIRGGTLSYRLLLINKNDVSQFSKVNTLEELNHFTAGLQNDWSTTKLFETTHSPLVKSQNFEGLFLMLNNHRIDYIPRAIYEVFDELSERQSKIENVVIAPNIALYAPMVSYFYVSPKTPLLAKRIELGLQKMVENGDLKSIFNRYYSEEITKAQLKGRTIIEIDNPYFNDASIRENNAMWKLH